MSQVQPLPVVQQKQEVIVATQHETVLSGRASDLVSAASRCAITNDETHSRAIDLVSMIKKCAKAVDDERRAIVDPLNTVVKHVNGRFKAVTEPLDRAEGKVKGDILAYQREKEAAARAEAQRRQKEAEEAALAEAAAKAEAGDTISAEVALDRAARTMHRPIEVAPSVGGETGARASTTKRWTFRVTDIAALVKAQPGCVEVKNSAVMGLFRAGITAVPGIEFYQEETVSVR